VLTDLAVGDAVNVDVRDRLRVARRREGEAERLPLLLERARIVISATM
jgi:hypothetical protein